MLSCLMNRRSFLQTAGAAAVALPLAGMKSSRPPNIVVILADDMGFSDIGSYGSEIPTPNLDELAQSGVKFTQFYNCARCCPSRASLLTGVYPHQAGMGHMVDKAGPGPAYADDLSPHTRTIGEVLRTAGYTTLMAGKWHVTPVNESKHNWPLQRGFQSYYGIIHGAADYFNPVTLTRDNAPETSESADYYFTDALGDNAVRMIAEASRQDKPYFLYAAFTAPHWPLHARPEDIEKFSGRYKDGWDALRYERHARQLQSGLLSKRWDLSPRDSMVPAWKDAQNKDWEARRMAVYAAMVHRLDFNIGRILKQITASGQEDNTLIMFMSDNGGCAEEIGAKWKGLHIPSATRDGRPVRVGNNPAVMPGAEDTYQSYGRPWANGSNTPLRMYKHWVHEGGISTPLLVRWPDRIKAARQAISEPCHFVDIMATCMEAGGAAYPSETEGAPTKPLQGQSLLPLISGKTRRFDRSIFWEHEGNCAVRRGSWKAVRKYPGEWELYNMDEDRTELIDRSKDRPKIASGMIADWGNWAKESGVVDWKIVSDQLVDR